MSKREYVGAKFHKASGSAGVAGAAVELIWHSDLQAIYSAKIEELFAEIVSNLGEREAKKMWEFPLPKRKPGAPRGARSTVRDRQLLLMYALMREQNPGMKETPLRMKVAEYAVLYSKEQSPEAAEAQLERLLKSRAAS